MAQPTLNVWFRCVEQIFPALSSEDYGRDGVCRRVEEDQFEVVLFKNETDPDRMIFGTLEEITSANIESTLREREFGRSVGKLCVCFAQNWGKLTRATKKNTRRALAIMTTEIARKLAAQAIVGAATVEGVRAKTFRGNALVVALNEVRDLRTAIKIVRLSTPNDAARFYSHESAVDFLTSWGAKLDSPTNPPPVVAPADLV